MAHVTVTIAARPYRMACNDGEEPHLQELAQVVDGKISELKGTFGEIGDQRITVMAALTLADELWEARRQTATLEAERSTLLDAHATALAARDDWTSSVAQALAQAAARIEHVSHEMSAGSARETAGAGPADNTGADLVSSLFPDATPPGD